MSKPIIVCALRAAAPKADTEPKENHHVEPVVNDVVESPDDVPLLEEVALRWNLRQCRGRNRESSHKKFSLNLTKKEITEDIYSLTGKIPHNYPRRRPVPIQKMLDRLVPGAPLEGLTPETYMRVPKKH